MLKAKGFLKLTRKKKKRKKEIKQKKNYPKMEVFGLECGPLTSKEGVDALTYERYVGNGELFIYFFKPNFF